jgi:hypothetical protein
MRRGMTILMARPSGYWMSVTFWRLEQERCESRRRIVAAMRTRAPTIESPPIVPF